MWQARDEQKKTTSKAKVESGAKKRQHEEFVIDKISHATKEAPDTPAVPNTQQISAIIVNKRREKSRERAEKAHRPDTDNNQRPDKVIHLSAENS